MQFNNIRMRTLAACLVAAMGLSACADAAREDSTSAGTFSFHNEGWAAAFDTDRETSTDMADPGGASTDNGNAEDGDAADTDAPAPADEAEDSDASPASADEAEDGDASPASAEETEDGDDADTDGKWSITLYANDGTDTMDVVTAEEDGESITLPANEFSREGYIFRGWARSKSQTSPDYSDMDTIEDTDVTALYAMWEAQMYIIEFDGNTADYGETEGMYALYNANAYLSRNGFRKSGYTFAGWMDSAGNTYEDRERIKNLDTGDTNCTKVLTVNAGKPLDEDYSFRSTQGSCVYEEDGVTYLVTTASINDAAYNKGDLSHYETILNKYNLETGELVDCKRNLAFDHGNSICYNPNNRHLYIAEGGSRDEYPGGVMEVDENLEEVNEYTFPLLDHIWAIAYDGDHFYILGKNEQSRNTLCTLNEEMKTLSYVELDDYYAQFSSQGIAADENYIYAVSAGFKTYEWKTKQRINVFTHEGRYVGVWTIDVQDEAEDITIWDGYAYINTNEHAQSTIYRTELPVVTLKAIWNKK